MVTRETPVKSWISRAETSNATALRINGRRSLSTRSSSSRRDFRRSPGSRSATAAFARTWAGVTSSLMPKTIRRPVSHMQADSPLSARIAHYRSRGNPLCPDSGTVAAPGCSLGNRGLRFPGSFLGATASDLQVSTFPGFPAGGPTRARARNPGFRPAATRPRPPGRPSTMGRRQDQAVG